MPAQACPGAPRGRAKILDLGHTAHRQVGPLQAKAGSGNWTIFTTALWGGHCHYWFMDEEPDAQRGIDGNLRSHSQ